MASTANLCQADRPSRRRSRPGLNDKVSVMSRSLRFAILMLLSVAFPGLSAHAQYVYPQGYGGWGGWGGATTAGGDQARGMGVFAAGAGAYNRSTAEARAINSDTVMQWNQYMYLSQQERNKRYYEKLARDKQRLNTNRDAIYDRLRNNPDSSDIARGDALNVVLDELTDPKIFAKVLKAADTPIPGDLVRNIPFQYASAAISVSMSELTKQGAPPMLKKPVFDAERTQLRALADELRKQNEEYGQLNPETLEKMRELLRAAHDKLLATQPKGTERNEAEKFIKSVFGLTRMLETPAIDVLMSGLKDRPETTLGHLLSFMNTFNLRFGPTETPQQRAVYTQLYPLLVDLRDKAVPQSAPRTTDADLTDPNSRPQEFFQGLDYQEIDPRTAPPGPGVRRRPGT